jgi:hypothetical protein
MCRERSGFFKKNVKKIETIEWDGIIMQDDILDGIELSEGGIRTFNPSTSSPIFLELIDFASLLVV